MFVRTEFFGRLENMEQLNSPIAVVAILAGVAVIFREVMWGMKTLRGTTGNPHQDRAFDKLAEAMDKVNLNLERLAERTQRIVEVSEKTHEALIRGKRD